MITLAQISQSVTETVSLMLKNMPIALICVGVLWFIHLLNFTCGYAFNRLGIYPRRPEGVIGIFLSPLLHADFEHLFFNSIPLFLLISFMLISGMKVFVMATLSIVAIGGLLVWVLGRRAIHVGASGLIMGYWGYLLAKAYEEPSINSVILAVVMLYYLGSLLFSLFPSEEKVSWEGHLFGVLAGVVTALFVV